MPTTAFSVSLRPIFSALIVLAAIVLLFFVGKCSGRRNCPACADGRDTVVTYRDRTDTLFLTQKTPPRQRPHLETVTVQAPPDTAGMDSLRRAFAGQLAHFANIREALAQRDREIEALYRQGIGGTVKTQLPLTEYTGDTLSENWRIGWTIQTLGELYGKPRLDLTWRIPETTITEHRGKIQNRGIGFTAGVRHDPKTGELDYPLLLHYRRGALLAGGGYSWKTRAVEARAGVEIGWVKGGGSASSGFSLDKAKRAQARAERKAVASAARKAARAAKRAAKKS